MTTDSLQEPKTTSRERPRLSKMPREASQMAQEASKTAQETP